MKNRLFRRLAVALAVTQALYPIAGYGTDLSDIPMAVSNSVKPNLMLVLDDSGSMYSEIIPETIPSDPDFPYAYFMFPKPQAIYGTTGYYSDLGSLTVPGFEETSRYARFFRTAKFNPLYYDPSITYTPWADPNVTSGTTPGAMPPSPPTAAPNNPYQASEGTINLTVNNSWSSTTTWDDYYWLDDDGTATLPTNSCITPSCGRSTKNASRTYFPATYFVWTATSAVAVPTTPISATNIQTNFQKVEIRPGFTYQKYAGRTDCDVSSCTYDQEIQNFANWYTYYRSRILATRAGIGKALNPIQDDSIRVGYGSINTGLKTIDGQSSSNTLVLGVRSFSGTAKKSLFSTFYGAVVPKSGTPLRQALGAIGEYYSRTDIQGPLTYNPGSNASGYDVSTDAACRQSFSLLMSDGQWNGNAAGNTSARGNIDQNDGSPYADSWTGTLADVARYYYKTDLRTLANKVPTDSVDTANWQHMVTYTVGFGVGGDIPLSLINSAFTPQPSNITWTVDPTLSTSGNAKIDDLAHAAINGRGGYFNAGDPVSLASSLDNAFSDIFGRNGAAAAVAVSNANVTSGDNASYASSYNSGNWTGDLQSYPLDLVTGEPDIATPNWSTTAQAQLNTRTATSVTYASTNRTIASYSGTSGIPFQPFVTGCTSNCISSAQQARLATPYTPPGIADGAAVVEYLRGKRTGEGTTYRSRSAMLGDIINAEPVIIREPLAGYADDCYKNAKSGKCTAAQTFKTLQASRTKVVAQGANDGMLHLLNAATGAELWAYVPNAVINMSDPSNTGTSTLNMLSRRNGYQHKYFVDGTPVVGDVDFSNTSGVSGNPDPEWKTILVGGLGKGGRGYYALDVTDPTASTESAAAAKVLWEFPNSTTSSTVAANIGYTYGKPIITKTAAYGWVVIVTSGYNNGTGADNSGGTGRGYVWILNAKTGAVLNQIDTGVGTTGAPAGLAHIAGWVDNGNIDNTTTHLYGGDLLGNLWRFDLTDSSGTINYTTQRLAVLRSGSTTTSPTQPITTVPELAEITIGSAAKRFVYVGTGQYMGTSDVDTNQKQTMYGLVDDMSTPNSGDVIPDPIRGGTTPPLVEQTLTTSGTIRTGSSNSLDFATRKGWYIDLPGCSVSSGDSCTKGSERINTDPAVATGVLVFTSNIPNSADPCSPGGSSFFNVVDYKTGAQVTGTSNVSEFLGNALASRVVLIKLPSGSIKALIRLSDATTVSKSVPPPAGGSSPKRMTWREITE